MGSSRPFRSWSSFRGDERNTGRSGVALRGPSSASASASVALGGLVWGTAVWRQAADGSATRVYVGSTNRVFACIEVPEADQGSGSAAGAAPPRVAWTFVVPQALAFVSQLGVPSGDSAVTVVNVRGLSVHRRLGVIHKLGRPLSPAARAFSAMLK